MQLWANRLTRILWVDQDNKWQWRDYDYLNEDDQLHYQKELCAFVDALFDQCAHFDNRRSTTEVTNFYS